ncbi:uncharacterized membrane protein (DUF485 family) [Nocardioides sp. BE266]|uniref:DUF485 domain-containing protein n=1 Tax=Nocardioides sp. BE266 TaxID=2817725 RepID=UPI002866ECFD|nr:DUF485 domain-containing protein [Nocardioides sp. BE266]MDR7254692.1 uncharacterized membrane protein (DUF485 family) [Nocardioides sp. BE266]
MTQDAHDQAARHDPVYDELSARPEFAELRSRYRRFVIPATAAFLAWYALYVLMSMFAHDFMSTKVAGNINVALVFGLLQFATTFLIAWLYSRYSNTNLDPLAKQLSDDYYESRER